MASSLDDLSQPQLDDPKRRYGDTFFDPAPTTATAGSTRQRAQVNRSRAADLAARGIPTYTDAQGTVSALKDETGAALSGYDSRHDIAYDSEGRPKQISYGETGPPVLTDAFDKLPPRVNPDTGAIERQGKGLYRYEGQDPVVTAQLAQKTKDKAVKEQATLLGERISLDRATQTNAQVDHDLLRSDLVSSVPILQDPKYEGADLPTVMKGIDEHFNARYAAPEANASKGWFGDGLSPEATALRAKIDADKATAIQSATTLFGLKDTLSQLDDKVAGEMTVRGEHIDTLLAHSRGEPGPLDQPETPAAKAAAGLYPPEKDWGRMLGGQPLEPDKAADPVTVKAHVAAGNIPPEAAPAAVAASHDAADALKKADELQDSNPTLADQFRAIGQGITHGLVTGLSELAKSAYNKPTWETLINPIHAGGAVNVAVMSKIFGVSPDQIRQTMKGKISEQLDEPMKQAFDKNLEGTVGAKVGDFIGGVAPYVAVAMATRGASIATPVMASLFYNSSFQRTYDDAKAHGADEGKATAAATTVGVINAALAMPLGVVGKAFEAVFGGTTKKVIQTAVEGAYQRGGAQGLSEILNQLKGAMASGEKPILEGVAQDVKAQVITALENLATEVKKTPGQRLVSVLKSATMGAAIGASVQTATNLVTKTYDPTRGTFEGVKEQALGFGALTGISKGFEQVAAARKAKQTLDLINSGKPKAPPGAQLGGSGPPPPPGTGPGPGETKPAAGGTKAPAPEPPIKQAVAKVVSPEPTKGGEPASGKKESIKTAEAGQAGISGGPEAVKPTKGAVPAEAGAAPLDIKAEEKRFIEQGGHADRLDAQNKLAALRKAFPDPAARLEQISKHFAAATGTVDEGAHQAATSPKNGLAEPTDAQKKAGNYKVGPLKVGGLDISIENPAGSKRKAEYAPLQSHYGYIKGTVGADKDHVDIFVKQGTPLDYSGPVFVVNQHNAAGNFDEHKAVMGVATAGEAKKEYLSNYQKGWTGGKSVVKFDTPAEFKAWATGGPKGPAVQPIKIVPPEGGSLHASQVEGPHVVSTAVKDNGRYLVGSKWNEPHAGIGARHGIEAVVADAMERRADRGFIVQDATGNRTFATRAQAEPIARAAGQIKGVIGDNGLQSENLQEAKAPEAVKPTVEPTKIGKLDRRAGGLLKRFEALKDVPATKALVIRTLLNQGNGKALDQAEAQLAKLEKAGQPAETSVTKSDEPASQTSGAAEAPTKEQQPAGGVQPDTGVSAEPAAQKPSLEKAARETVARWEKAHEPELTRLGTKLVEKPTGPAGLFYDILANEIHYDLALFEKDAASLPEGEDPHELLESRLHEEHAHAADMRVSGGNLTGHLLLWGSLPGPNKAALRAVLAGNQAVVKDSPHSQAAEYIARLFMHRNGLALPENLFRDVSSLVAVLDGPQPAQIEAHLAKMTAAVAEKAPSGAPADEMGSALDALVSDLFTEPKKKGVTDATTTGEQQSSQGGELPRLPTRADVPADTTQIREGESPKADAGGGLVERGPAPAAGGGQPAKKARVKKVKLSAEEQKLIDDATSGLFATPAKEGATEQKSVEAERVAKFSALARMILSKGIDTPQGAADFMKANIGEKMLPYAQALWDAMALSKPELYGTHNWDALFAGKAPAEKKAPKNAPNGAVSTKVSPIEDFGEKIGGARKDKWAERGLRSGDLEGMTDIEKNAYATRDNVWPSVDYAQLIADGMPKPIAWIVKDIRSQIAKAPVLSTRGIKSPGEHDEQLRLYIDTVEKLRDGLSKVRSTQDIRDLWKALFVRGESGYLPDAYNLVARRTGYRTKLSSEMQPGGYEEQWAKRKLEATDWPTPQEAWQRMFDVNVHKAGQEIWTHARGRYTLEKDDWFVTRKNSSQILKEGFETKEQAEEFAKSQVPAGGGARLTRPFKGDATRVGPDYREGKDVTGEQILQTFGFRGGEFGHWTNQADRQQSLNQAFDGLKDLARVLRLPDAAISLNGELGIAFGARGSGKAAAHYEPIKVVINLTKTQGSGSLAHEWMHAIDDYFGKQAGRGAAAFASSGAIKDQASQLVRAEVVQAWSDVMRAITVKTAVTELDVAEAQTKLDRIRRRIDDWVSKKAQTIQDPEKEEQFHHIMAMLRMEEPRYQPEWPNVTPSEDKLVDDLQKLLGPQKLDAEYRKGLVNNAYWAARYYKGVERAIAGEVTEAKPSAFYAAALKKEKGDKEGYWARLHEMFARAGESYVQRKFGAEGGSSDYLVHSTRGDASSPWGALYPTEPESAEIDKAFEELFGTIKTETTEKGTRLYATGIPNREGSIQLLEGVLDNNFPAWRRTPKEKLPEKAQKLIDQLVKQVALPRELHATPVQVGIPEGKEDQFLAVARVMIQNGINTPKLFSDYLEGRYGEKMRPYYQALWNAIGIVDNKLRGQHDWEQMRQVAPEPEPAKDTKSFVAEMNTASDKEDTYTGNGMRFISREAAEQYANDLMSRWMAVRKYRVVPSPDEPTHDGNGNLLALPVPAPSPTEQLAAWVADKLDAGEPFKSAELFAAADRIFGGTMGEAKYTSKDAYDAMELGMNRWILAANLKPEGTLAEAKGIASVLQAKIQLLPSQTKRTEEQQDFQQFSTPPPFAFVAAWVADISPNDVVAETSAGIGGLAIFPKLAGATVHVNELSDRRANILRIIFGENVTEHDAELWHALAPDVHPTVGLINPPFSATAGRTASHKSVNGAKQIESLLDTLEPGGRLVTITGKSMGPDEPAFREWWQKIAAKYNVRANIGVDGHLYQKYGTTFDNQLIVIDKPLAGSEPISYAPVTGSVTSYDQLLDLLAPIRDLRRAQGVPEVAPEPPGFVDTGAGGTSAPAADEPSVPATDVLGTGPAGGGTVVPEPVGERPSPATTGGTQRPPRPKGSGGSVSTGEPRPSGEPAGTADKPAGSSGELAGNAERGGGTDASELDLQSKAEQESDVTDAIFVPWVSNVDIPGSKPHPTPLVESASMAAVQMPTATYKPKLSKEAVESGALSDAQIVPIIYAGQAHEQMLPDGVNRYGYFVGDGTGVGKGRIIAGIMADNRAHGRQRGIWLSQSQELQVDAMRDLAGVGDAEVVMANLSKVKSKTGTVDLKNGILFATYDTLKGDSQLAGFPPEYRPTAIVTVKKDMVNANGTVIKTRTMKGQTVMTVKMGDGTIISDLKPKDVTPVKPAVGQKSRLDQVVEWFGADYDGPIMFDESHNAANSLRVAGERGGKAPSQKALAVVALQERLPKARIVYVSATGATEVANLAYAERLGIWGPGAFFPNKLDFISKIAAAGLSAMEIIARDLKTLGLMNARTLSFGPVNPDDPKDKGVEFGILQHDLSDDQKGIYDEMARAWQLVFRNMNQALEQTGGANSGQARGRARGAYFSAAQRFFNQTLTAMQMPTILKDMHTRLDEGHAILLQIVNTNEATQERGLAQMEAEETDLEDVDTSPKDILKQYVNNSFPTALFQEVSVGEGSSWVMVIGPDGLPVQDPKAVAMKLALLDKIDSLPVPNNPLEQILDEFGTENVAEITGRRRRIVWGEKNGQRVKVLEERSDNTRRAEVADFNNDKRKILIFSAKGGTGFSYHSDLGFANQRRRWHYLVQAGWRADRAIQGLGRGHRSNEANAPMIQLSRTNLDAHKRFISTIARRLSQLGAVTAGDRRSTGQGLFSEADNLENEYSQRALDAVIEEAYARLSGALPWELITDKLGMDNLVDPESGSLSDSKMPSVPQFLNRLLALEFEEGNMVFGRFYEKLQANIELAQEHGTYDPGLQTLRVDKGGTIEKKSDDPVYTHPGSGGVTRLVEIEIAEPAKFLSWQDLIDRYGDEPDKVIENKRSGSLFAIYPAGNFTDRKTGKVVPQVRKVNIKHADFVPVDEVASTYEADRFVKVPMADAPALWAKQIAEADPIHREKKTFLVGLFLPIWNKLTMIIPRVYQFKTTDKERMLGILVPPRQIENVRKALGMGMKVRTPAEVFKSVKDFGLAFSLANGWKIGRSRIASEYRVEVKGPMPADQDNLLNHVGLFVERIAFKPRYFVPTNEKGVEVMTRLLAQSPITSEGTSTLTATPIISDLYEEDVAPILKGVKLSISEVMRMAVRTVSPTTGVAEPVLDRAMKMIGDRNQVAYVIDRALHVYQKAFDKMSRHDAINFVDSYKAGEVQATPELQALDKMMREIDHDAWIAAVKAYQDLGISEEDIPIAWKENHYRVMWKKIPGEHEDKPGKGLGKRPLRGSQGMRRMSTLDSMSEGIALGGEPYSWNPVINFKQAQADIWKLTTALQAWKWAKDADLVEFVRGRHPKLPPGKAWMEDSITRVYFKAASGEGLIEPGRYAVDEGLARVFNNYLSSDAIRKLAIGRGLLWLKNATTSLELSLSIFHGIFETLEAVGSNLGLGLSQLVNRGILRGDLGAAAQGIKNMLTAAISPVTGFSLGRAVRDAAANPDEYFQTAKGKKLLRMFPRARDFIPMLFTAGWKPTELAQDWKNNSIRTFIDATAEIKAGNSDNYIGAGLRAFPAANEMLMKPLFDHLVPNLKLAQWFKEFDEALKQQSNKYGPHGYYIDRSGKRWERPSDETLAREIWRLVEDRFGELNYDTLFWNNTFKTAMQLMFRSVTWKLGSVEAFGGAFAGQAREFRDAIRERRAPELHRNMAWVFGMFLLTAALGIIISKALSGKWPQSLTDVVFPQIDPKDDKVRVSLPTYFKDLVHLFHSPTSYVTSSMSGWIGRLADLLRNKDYYGTQIRDTDDPIVKQALAVGKYGGETLLPFSIRGYKNLSAQDVNTLRKLLAVAGVNPAPRFVGQTAAERASDEYWRSQRTEAGIRPGQYESKLEKRKLVAQIHHGESPDIGKALAAGVIKPRDIKSLYQRGTMGALTSQVLHMPLEEAERIYQRATLKERAELAGVMAKKRAAAAHHGKKIFTGF